MSMTLRATIASDPLPSGSTQMEKPLLAIDAEPYEFVFEPARTARSLLIDMQRDFLEPGGFGEMLGNDVSLLRSTIEPNRRLLRRVAGRGPARSSTRARAIARI